MKIIDIFESGNSELSINQDDRGIIADFFFRCNINHGCWIISKEGSVRGNHYHRHTTQYTLVISGNLFYRSRIMLSDNISEGTFGRGVLIISPPFEAHAMRALNGECQFLAFAEGPRGGRDYESDTYRLVEDELLIRP